MTNFFNIDEAHFTLLERSQKLNQFFLRGFQPVAFLTYLQLKMFPTCCLFDLFATSQNEGYCFQPVAFLTYLQLYYNRN